jgi:glycosyltransferase involved in cell wall biosynthesis
MEAMAAGRASVASDIGGISELVTQGRDGLLTPPTDAEALTEAILRLAQDKDLRSQLGKKAREKAMKEFSIEDSTRKTIEVYKKTITKD